MINARNISNIAGANPTVFIIPKRHFLKGVDHALNKKRHTHALDFFIFSIFNIAGVSLEPVYIRKPGESLEHH